MSNQDKYWIGFSSVSSDSQFILTLYNHFGDIEKAWNCTDLSFYEGLTVDKAEKFLKSRDKVNLDSVMNMVTDRNLSYITYDELPYMLKQIDNPPATLYYKGDLNLCNFEKTLAVVGSRRATRAAKDILSKIISQFTGTDICIVSGLAAGIDTTAHEAALNNGLKTIGVIASGHDFIYPTNNRDLYKRIENGNGVIFSEYFPTVEPLRFHFPQRNRIVTGLSYGTVVAEASLKSGALISANLCLEQGRELMCIPGLISNPNTEGIYKLLKNGATLVTCAEDILNALNWEIKTNYQQMFFDFSKLTEEQVKITECIKCEPKNFDMILNETQLSADILLINLTELELNGIIKQIEGEKYQLA